MNETPGASSPQVTRPRIWLQATGLVLGLVVALVLLFHATAASMVGIWWRSQTFAHGFLVVPASALVVWRVRHRVTRLVPRPAPVAFAVIALLGFGWTLGHAAELLVIEQACFVGMVVASVWAVLGTSVVRQLAFPLGFLFLAVPAGEVLISPLMEFTTRFTVRALQLTGVPVARDGDYLRIPGGEWRIIEACSGFRYLLASVMLGCLYAWMTYVRKVRRILFIAASVLAPILANGVRAYLIIMLGYLSDMKIATGIDHYIYGWVFFAVVMAGLFWAGSAWREPSPEDAVRFVVGGTTRTLVDRGGALRRALAAVAAVVICAVWPVYARMLDQPPPTGVIAPQAPAPRGGWERAPYPWTDWKPDYQPFDADVEETYRKGDAIATIYLGFYLDQRQDRELVNMQNVLVSTRNKVWRKIAASRRHSDGQRGSFDVEETLIRSADRSFVAWSWYWVAGSSTANPFRAKWLGARARLLRSSDGGALVVAMVPYERDPAAARSVLTGFVRDMLPSVLTTLRAAAPGAASGPGSSP